MGLADLLAASLAKTLAQGRALAERQARIETLRAEIKQYAKRVMELAFEKTKVCRQLEVALLFREQAQAKLDELQRTEAIEEAT